MYEKRQATLPVEWDTGTDEDLLRMGFRIEPDADDSSVLVTLPEGWRVRGEPLEGGGARILIMDEAGQLRVEATQRMEPDGTRVGTRRLVR